MRLIDVVPVVRCKDCIYAVPLEKHCEDFCSYGKRRVGNEAD